MIEAHDLTKRFPLSGGNDLLAVGGVSFRVEPGEVYGLLGPNGAGKTTTLRMLLGLLQPTSGYASIGGFRSTDFPDEVKRRIGLVSANVGLYQWLSVREMLLFFGDLYAVPPSVGEARLQQLSQLLGLQPFLDRRCVTLSTGQKQRVSLARALMHNPPVMLLDEPTTGLDVLASQVVIEYTGHLRDQGKAVVMSTHRLDEAERLCDRYGLLHHGKIVIEGTLSELRERTGCQTLVDMFLKLANAGPALAAAPADAS